MMHPALPFPSVSLHLLLQMADKSHTPIKGQFTYYVSMNNQWSIFKKMTKDDREGLRVIRKDDVWWKIQWFKGMDSCLGVFNDTWSEGMVKKSPDWDWRLQSFLVQGYSYITSSTLNHQGVAWRYYIWRPGGQKRRLVGNIKFIIIFIFRRKFVH